MPCPQRCAVAVFAFAALTVAAAHADPYPGKPIQWVVPSSPGDGSDTFGRLLAERVGSALGQAIVVQNRPGAGGVVGSEYVARAVPDGYTMIVGNAGSHGINAAIYTHLPYDVQKDFVAVALICTTPNVMVVNNNVKAHTVREFIETLKKNPGKIDYASGGVGSSAHMSAELFKSMAGVDMTHIPYKGATPATASVLANETQTMIGNLPPWLPLLKSGKVRALAVTSPERSPALPDVPPLSDTVPGFDTVAWFGVLAPANTPEAIVALMNKQINAALAQKDLRDKLEALSCMPAPGTPEAFAARIGSDIARWKALASQKNIHADR
jgi:tripartite-type tricarboxylate transporter receptor subunit TctC